VFDGGKLCFTVTHTTREPKLWFSRCTPLLMYL